MAPPVIMPAMAPARLERFQNRERSMTGPNAAPKPAQAKETTRNTELSGFHASTRPTSAMPMTVSLATSSDFFSLSRMPRNSTAMSCETLDAAASSWESAVDMVAARMPARITPATTANSAPWLLITSASLTMTVSLSTLVPSIGMMPAAEML